MEDFHFQIISKQKMWQLVQEEDLTKQNRRIDFDGYDCIIRW